MGYVGIESNVFEENLIWNVFERDPCFFNDASSIFPSTLDSGNKPLDLDWVRRSGICLGTAKGLSFLHEELDPHIVHRDIKASNVLLDKHLNPKIGDFGLAKLFPDNVTHLSTRVAGTA